jgi:hypothetical protein
MKKWRGWGKTPILFDRLCNFVINSHFSTIY